MKKLFVVTIFILLVLQTETFAATNMNTRIDAEMNAALHNNMGLEYLKEKYYFGAIKEFEIAIGISPNTQAASVYHTNLGKTYMKIGYPQMAQTHFERAIELYPLNFEYYQNLVSAFEAQGILKDKLNFYTENKKNCLDDITIGLIYGSLGETKTEITVLDEFCNNEPELLIIPAVKKYVKKQTKILKTKEEKAF